MKKSKLKIVEAKPMQLLPPPSDACQVCAVKHPSNQPHNPQSLYYQVKFQMENGRGATWNDAMAHCEQSVQDLWWLNLSSYGITKENGKVNA